MFDCCIDKCSKVSKFHVFIRKNRNIVEKHENLMFECWNDKCSKVSKFHVSLRKNRKKGEIK